MMGSRGFSGLLKRQSTADLELLRAGLVASEEAGSHIYRIFSRYLLGQWHFLLGEFRESLNQFETAFAIAGQSGMGNLFQPGLLLGTAETEAKLGFLDRALDHIQRYDELIWQVGPLEGLAWFPSRGVANRVRGIILTKQRALEAAATQFSESLKLLADHGYRLDLARTHVALGEHELERGRSREARQAFERAASCFQEMGFTFELQQMQRALEAN
jgi:tetratricopeptide (TPR) repeat protein